MKRKDYAKPFTGLSNQTQDFIIRTCFVEKEDIGQYSLSLLCDHFSEIFHVWPNPEMCEKLSYLAHYVSFTILMTNILLYCSGHFKVCAHHS